jgi:hypothetical protein
MKHHPIEQIEQFVAQVRERLNQHHGFSVLVRSLVVGGAVMTGVALIYIVRGSHVPWVWYPVVFGTVSTVGAGAWWFTRHSQDQAAFFADHHFELKDSVRSYSGFHSHGKNAGFYALQAEQTHHKVTPLKVSDIVYQWPTILTVTAIVLLLTCSLLGFIKDSPERVAAHQEQALILDQSEAINDQLKDALETLEKQLREEDLDKIVDVNTLKDWVNQLRETPDITEAMRQYAQFEKNLKSLSMQLQQRKDQQLLDRMGRELQKDDASKALGKQLSQRDYETASESLSNFKINSAALSKAQQAQVDKLKAMSGRMAQEVTRSKTSSEQASKALKSESDMACPQGAESSKDPLSDKVEQLNQSAQQMSEAMRQAQKQSESQNSQACQQCAQGANRDLTALAQHVQRMGARQQAQAKIDQLLQSLSQTQRGLGQMPGPGQGQGESPGQGPDGSGQGGKEAGTGSDSSINTNPVGNTDQGFLDQVKGTHGSGSSATAIEEASDGSGSNAGSDTRDREIYQRQMESFIRREDVPEAVKSGVKAYFENIHQVEEGP